MITATIFLKDRRKNPIIIENVQKIKTLDFFGDPIIISKNFSDFSLNNAAGDVNIIGNNSSCVTVKDEIASIKFEKSK